MADESAPAAPLNSEIEPQAEIAAESEPENGGSKRNREEDEGSEPTGEKRIRAESEVEEKSEEPEKQEEEANVAVVGMKTFGSSVEMFDYFYKLLHTWPPNIDLNKYEHIMVLELLKKGHMEAERKIGCGIKGFQVRFHPQFKSRCFFLIRDDESVDDFSFRKCVDRILTLPETMQIKHDVNKALRGKGGGAFGRGRGRGHRGRGRK
ncbi:protein DCL, chloroplastic-like [Dorcoceras hygrometricum]|uniref:Protein DCL, chloroplastic-like n=1 Tax=Dorcoceras hygrometricum TaxID=472368 RepID=A0A2Z7AVQ4_9LAMI|nr:protein DCL, chloroplastic-like [Dorcoceras hygrometricum]